MACVLTLHRRSVFAILRGRGRQAGRYDDDGPLVSRWDGRVTVPAMLLVWLSGALLAVEGALDCEPLALGEAGHRRRPERIARYPVGQVAAAAQLHRAAGRNALSVVRRYRRPGCRRHPRCSSSRSRFNQGAPAAMLTSTGQSACSSTSQQVDGEASWSNQDRWRCPMTIISARMCRAAVTISCAGLPARIHALRVEAERAHVAESSVDDRFRRELPLPAPDIRSGPRERQRRPGFRGHRLHRPCRG